MANLAAAARAAAQARWPGATVVDRTPTGIYHVHPTMPSRTMIDCSAGGVYHLGNGSEVDSDWETTSSPADQPYQWRTKNAAYKMLFSPGNNTLDTAGIVKWVHQSSGLGVDLSFGALEYVTTTGALQQIAVPTNLGTTPAGDKVVYPQAYGTGWELTLLSDLSSFKKQLRFARSLLVGAPANTEWVRMTLRIGPDNGVNIFVNGQPWGGGGSQPVETSQPIEFRNNAGTVLWIFRPPAVWNETSSERGRQWAQNKLPVTWLRRQGNNLNVQVYVPWDWFGRQNATDILVIDPTIDEQVAAGGDDGFWTDGWALYFSNWNPGSVGYDTGTFHTMKANSRFTNISGLSGATIDVSYMELNNQGKTNNPRGICYAFDEAASAQVSSYADWNGRAVTAAQSAEWFPWGTVVGVWEQSPSLNSVIQELADSYDPSVIQVIVDNNAGTSANNSWSHGTQEMSGTIGAKLHIEYTAGGGGGGGQPMYYYQRMMGR